MPNDRLVQACWELHQHLRTLTRAIVALTKAVNELRKDRQPDKEAPLQPSTPDAEV
jgi:hypothetical protein